jgi:hypothetical protein
MIDDAWGYWFAGFFDGEGCLLVKRMHRGRRSSRYVCGAEITLRADDAAILHEIAERTGIGQVHDKRGGDDPRRPNPFSRWQFSRKAEARALVAIFDRYPLRAKRLRGVCRDAWNGCAVGAGRPVPDAAADRSVGAGAGVGGKLGASRCVRPAAARVRLGRIGGRPHADLGLGP